MQKRLKKRVRAYRAKNPDKVRALWRKWEQDNPEKVTASRLKFYATHKVENRLRKNKWVSENRSRVNTNAVKLRAKNPEKARAQAKRRYDNNPEQDRSHSRKSYHKDPQKWMARHREWVKNNPEKAKESVRNSRRKRLESDPALRIRLLLSNRILRAVREQYTEKAYKTMEVLGCTIREFMAFIEAKFEPGMHWGNRVLGPIVR